MSRAPSTFRKQDMTRAVQAVLAAGVSIKQVEVDKAGKIVVIAGTERSPAASTGNEWDDVK